MSDREIKIYARGWRAHIKLNIYSNEPEAVVTLECLRTAERERIEVGCWPDEKPRAVEGRARDVAYRFMLRRQDVGVTLKPDMFQPTILLSRDDSEDSADGVRIKHELPSRDAAARAEQLVKPALLLAGKREEEEYDRRREALSGQLAGLNAELAAVQAEIAELRAKEKALKDEIAEAPRRVYQVPPMLAAAFFELLADDKVDAEASTAARHFADDGDKIAAASVVAPVKPTRPRMPKKRGQPVTVEEVDE
jgi:outer membrane murein-binding lipoprotein Lpp